MNRQEEHEDKRERVQNTEEFPFSAIARIRSGTGFFIGPYHVLTAAHVVDDVDLGNEDLTVYPAMNTIRSKPFNYAEVKDIEIYEKYFDWWRIGLHDLAILTLDRSLGDHTGWFEIRRNVPEEYYTNNELELAGYLNDPPQDAEKHTMWTDTADRAYDVTGTTHRYKMETSGGQSGSPIWYYDEDLKENYVLSVHSGSPRLLDFARGTRITESKYDWIMEIKNKTSPPRDHPDLLYRGQIIEGSFNDFGPNLVEAGNDSFKLSLDVKNAGTNTVEEDVEVSFYLIENPPGNLVLNPEPEDLDYYLGKDTIQPPIYPFEYKTADWEGTLPADILSGKYYQLVYHIDEKGDIEEFDETNNMGYFLESDRTKNKQDFLTASQFIEVVNPVDTPWPSFGHDRKNTGRSPYDTAEVNGTKKWTFATEDDVWSSPSVGKNNVVYFGSDDNNLYAINPNGTERWKFETGGRIYSSPLIDNDGTIYIGSYDGNLYALHSEHTEGRAGTEKWQHEIGARVSSSPALSSGGTIYVGSWDKNLHAINRDGTEKWTFETGGRITSSPAIGEDGTIYFGSYDNNLYAIEDKDQNPEKKWQFDTNGRVSSSPTVSDDGTIYISADNHLYAVHSEYTEGRAGTEKWSFETGDRVDSSPSVGEDGTIYFGSRDNNLYAVNPDGTEKWRFETGYRVSSSPAIGEDGTIYFGSKDNNLYAVNPDGTEKWRFETGGEIHSSPAIGGNETIYVGSRDNYLYAIGNRH